MDLVAHCLPTEDGALSGVWLALAGPCDVPGTMVARAGQISLGVRFRIGWGGACLRVDPAALRNRVLVGREVVRQTGIDADSILKAPTVPDLRDALVAAVRAASARARPGAGHARAMAAIEVVQAAPPEARLQSAQDGVASRTLRRDVLAAAGLPLRCLAGIVRFQRAMRLLKAGDVDTLGALAFEAGFSDQAHMTREFRRFGGFTPSLPREAPIVG
nr:helix-turn-helix domain-containing protein [Variovorax sp. PAMC 28711]